MTHADFVYTSSSRHAEQQQQEEEEEEEEDTCIISGYECEYMNREMHIIIFMNTHTEREREKKS